MTGNKQSTYDEALKTAKTYKYAFIGILIAMVIFGIYQAAK